MWLKRPPASVRFALGAVLCTCTVAQTLYSQPAGQAAVRGTVLDIAGTVIEGALVTIEGATVVVETNDAGDFIFRAVNTGSRMLRVRRLGFRADSQLVTLTAGRTSSLRIVLQPVPTALPAVQVTGRHELTGPMVGFYRRRATGSGRFFTSDDIEKRNPARLTDLLRNVPGLAVSTRSSRSSVRIRGSRCAPVVFLDGQGLSSVEFDLDSVDPKSFAGIEVYSGASSVPVEFQRNSRVSSSCGTILLWSKRGEPSPRRGLRNGMTPAALIARMIESQTVLSRSDVDTAARVDSTVLVVPVYPSSLFESAIPGRVLAEFVVDADGDADMQTFSAVTSTHPSLINSVRSAVSQQRFRAAWRGGTTVHQVMQLHFNFVPDSSVLRKR